MFLVTPWNDPKTQISVSLLSSRRRANNLKHWYSPLPPSPNIINLHMCTHHLSAVLPFPNATKGQKAISAAMLGKSGWFCTLSYASLCLSVNSKHNTEIDPEWIIKSLGVSCHWFDLRAWTFAAPARPDILMYSTLSCKGFGSTEEGYTRIWCLFFYFFFNFLCVLF